jgi:type VI secretion system protein VasD
MDMHSLFRRCLAAPALALLLSLAGCASGGGAVPSATDAVPAAGDAASQASGASDAAEGPITRMMQAVGLARKAVPKPTEQQLPLRIFTASNLNAGPGSKALALVVKVYHLRSLDRFQQTPFDAFLDKDKTRAALGDDLIDGREMLLLPDQHYVSTEHMPLDTRYLGFVALFRAPAAQRWRFAYDVKRSTAGGITLGVHACAMSSTDGALVTELPDDPGSLASVHCPRPGA